MPQRAKKVAYCSRACAGRAHSAAMKGEGNSNYAHGRWMPGGEFSPYPEEFVALQKVVRQREKHRCFLCGKHRKQNGQNLDVHHIDYDIYNNCKKNLVALCRPCHSQMHGGMRNRLRWARRLFELLSEVYGYPQRSITFKSLQTTITSLGEY